jgi:Zn-dependent protease
MPSLDGATGWLNSEPLGPAELRGRVVLVNFWTLTCINWLRQEPYVRAWSNAYRDDGLIVIGVHTPAFSFEREIDGVRQATKERGIDYPVALDNDYAIWSAFDNHYWPALYFVDAEGVIRDQHFGEGRYDESEHVIQRLLGVERELVSVERLGVEAEADWDHLRTPETYVGSARGERRVDEPPERLRLNHWHSPANGRSGARRSCSSRPTAASRSASTRATRIWCFRPERASRLPSACCSTVRLRAGLTAWTSTRMATACSRTGVYTSSCASTKPSASAPSKSPSSSPGPRHTRSRSGSQLWGDCEGIREETSMASGALSRPSAGGGEAKRKEQTMDGSFTIGRLGGVEVRLHWSLLVVFALIVWSLADGVFPSQNPGLSDGTYLGAAIVAAQLFLASILLHELGHSWVARRKGIEVDSITLWIFGGVAQFKDRFASAGSEFRVAVSGPLISIGLGALFMLIALAGLPSAVDADSTIGDFMDNVAWSQRFTTYPVLDGGRPVGPLAFASVTAVPRSEWDSRRVRDTMIPLHEVPLLTEDEKAVDALAELSAPRANRGLVVDNGHLAGLLSITDLARALEVGRRAAQAPGDRG